MSNFLPRSLKLPNELIPVLQKPMGKLFKVSPDFLSPEKRIIKYLENKDLLVFVVGDFVSNSLLVENFLPDLIIIDDKTQRNTPFKVELPKKFELLKANNEPGEINKSSWELLRILCNTVFDQSEKSDLNNFEKVLKVIKISGEEDLLVLPLIIESPLNSVILYGFPPMLNGDHGIVLIEVTKELKMNIKDLLMKFDSL